LKDNYDKTLEELNQGKKDVTVKANKYAEQNNDNETIRKKLE